LSNIVIKHLNWQSCVWLHTLSSYMLWGRSA